VRPLRVGIRPWRRRGVNGVAKANEVTMLKSMFVSGFSLAAACGALEVAAADWSSQSELGFVAARGNTTTETANAKFEIVRESEVWKNSFGARALYGRASEIESAERYDARDQLDHFFGEKSFWFLGGRYEDDEYGGFAYQATGSAGFGRRFYDDETTKLSTQIGVGYRSLRSEELIRDESLAVIDRIPGERQQDIVANGAITFEHAFNDNTKVSSSFLVESGSSNTFTRNDLALQVKMTEVLALSLGLSVRNNSEPQQGLKNTDTLTTVNLVYVRSARP
jgi:putative salt-induced outer membrane protein